MNDSFQNTSDKCLPSIQPPFSPCCSQKITDPPGTLERRNFLDLNTNSFIKSLYLLCHFKIQPQLTTPNCTCFQRNTVGTCFPTGREIWILLEGVTIMTTILSQENYTTTQNNTTICEKLVLNSNLDKLHTKTEYFPERYSIQFVTIFCLNL